jgi:transposase
LSKRHRHSLTKRELLAENALLRKRIEELEAIVAELRAEVAALRKNSSTSSKPPSSDIVKPSKPPAPRGAAKRTRGGQPGHPRNERSAFPPERVDSIHEYRIDVCPDCAHTLEASPREPRIVQQVDVVEKPFRVEEHRAFAGVCRRCGKIHYAPLPETAEKGGLLGPRLTAQVAYLKGSGHMSYSTVKKYLRDVLGLNVSRGLLAKAIHKVTCALQDPYSELLALLAGEAVLNVDETGHKENGQRLWTWCFRARLYTLFKIDPSRGSQVLLDVLGEEFAGVLGCDYFSAYRKFMKDLDLRLQFCLAHLIRDLKFLTTLPNKQTAAYGKRILDEVRALFAIIRRRDKMGRNAFAKAMRDQRRVIIDAAIRGAPDTRHARNMVTRFDKHGDAYFQFITTPGIEPTNNLAEQAIRFVVIDRHITQGTRGERGRQWCERIWTVMATCAMRGCSAYDYLVDVVNANLQGQPAPSLLRDSA